MDDLETIIAKAMDTTIKMQRLHAKAHTPVDKTELTRKELTVVEAVNKIRCIPERFRQVVSTMLADGVPPAIAELTPALDQTGVQVPFLTLVGKTGVGKTSTALALPVARYMLAYSATWTSVEKIVHSGEPTAKATNKIIDQRMFNWKFMHADDICTCRRSSKLGEDPRELTHAFSWNPLIIDDVIGQKDQDGDLYRVLRHREENGYQTIITSGLTPPAIETAYGPQFSRRMFSGLTKLIEKKPGVKP
jgi:hypothetical protein